MIAEVFIISEALSQSVLSLLVITVGTEILGMRIISTGLPRLGPLALSILKAQEVTTKGVYRLPHAIYCSSSVSGSPRATSVETTSKRIKPSPSNSGTTRVQFAEGLHFSAFSFQKHFPKVYSLFAIVITVGTKKLTSASLRIFLYKHEVDWQCFILKICSGIIIAITRPQVPTV